MPVFEQSINPMRVLQLKIVWNGNHKHFRTFRSNNIHQVSLCVSTFPCYCTFEGINLLAIRTLCKNVGVSLNQSRVLQVTQLTQR